MLILNQVLFISKKAQSCIKRVGFVRLIVHKRCLRKVVCMTRFCFIYVWVLCVLVCLCAWSILWSACLSTNTKDDIRLCRGDIYYIAMRKTYWDKRMGTLVFYLPILQHLATFALHLLVDSLLLIKNWRQMILFIYSYSSTELKLV